jgi:hypothetical protein
MVPGNGSGIGGDMKHTILALTAIAVAAFALAAMVQKETYNEIPLQIIKNNYGNKKGDTYLPTGTWGNSRIDTTEPYTIDIAGSDTTWAYSLAIDADSCNGAVKTQFGRNSVWMPVSSTDSVKRRSTGGIAQATTAGDSIIVGQFMNFRRAAVAPGASQVRFIIATTTGNSVDDNDAGALTAYPYSISIVRPDPKRR